MIVAAALVGTFSGILTGLIPGIHVNTVTALLLAGSAALASIGVEYPALLVFTCALAISHTFFDVVPGLFLGVPGDEAFAQLPGHRLVKQGAGEAAIRLSVVGSLSGLALGLAVMVSASAASFIAGAEGLIRPVMFYVLALVSGILILTDRHRGWSLVTFLVSGLLGVAVFGSPLVAGGSDAPINALFPSLAGLFGVAGLLFAIYTVDSDGPPRVSVARASLGLGRLQMTWSGGVGGLAGLLVGLLPGLGAANAATLLLLAEKWLPWRKREAGRNRDRASDEADARTYLVTTSSLNTSEALFAIAALVVIGRSRSGASIAVEQILGGIVFSSDLLPMAVAMATSGIIAALVLWHGGPRFARAFSAVDENGLNWGVVAFLVILTLVLLGLGGLAILVTATAIGLVPLLFGVRRAQLMGFFLVPAMLFFSGQQVRLVELLPMEQRTAPLLPSTGFSGTIVVAILAAIGAGMASYFMARRSGLRVWRASRAWPRWALPALGGLGVVLVLVLTLLGQSYPGLDSTGQVAPPDRSSGRIERVVDGDTFLMASGGRRFGIRLKGIDAPELRTAEGQAARDQVGSRFADAIVVWIPLGVDQYGRMVADVHLGDGTLVNAEIVRMGHARASRDFPSEHQELLLSLESEARRDRRGMWGRTPAPSPADGGATREPGTDALMRWDDNRDGRITCAEARGHGIAPVPRGHPAYPYMRDANNDGIVCN